MSLIVYWNGAKHIAHRRNCAAAISGIVFVGLKIRASAAKSVWKLNSLP